MWTSLQSFFCYENGLCTEMMSDFRCTIHKWRGAQEILKYFILQCVSYSFNGNFSIFITHSSRVKHKKLLVVMEGGGLRKAILFAQYCCIFFIKLFFFVRSDLMNGRICLAERKSARRVVSLSSVSQYFSVLLKENIHDVNFAFENKTARLLLRL